MELFKNIFKNITLLVVLICFLFLLKNNAFAGATLTSGDLQLGVYDYGNIIDDNTSIGLYLNGVGDAITPGCWCEGWGITGNGTSGGASWDNSGGGNLTLDSFTSTATTATSVVHLTTLPNLIVTHAFAPAPAAPTSLFEVKVTIRNTGASPINNIVYRRNMDWDIPPTEFNEYVTIQGLPATSLIFCNDNGFFNVDPLVSAVGNDIGGCGETVNFTDCGPADHGALFDFSFGTLNPGESKTFSIFYGATTNETSAISALSAVQAEIYSLGQSNGGQGTGEPATFIFGFKGVGGQPLGEEIPTITDSGIIILITLFGGLTIFYLKRKSKQVS